MIPRLKITRDSRIKQFLVYREYTEYPKYNLAHYKTVNADIIANNVGSSDVLIINDSMNIEEENIIKKTSPKLTNPYKVEYEVVYSDGQNPKIKFRTINDNSLINIYYLLIGIDNTKTSLASARTKIQFRVNSKDIKNQVFIIDNLLLDDLSFTDWNEIDVILKDVIKEPVKSMNSDDITANLKYINSNIINLNLKNIWNDNSYKERATNQIEIKSKYECSSVLNDVIETKVNIPIDKLIILRKEDDGTSDHILINDEAAKSITLVRAEGKYDNYENNKDFITDGICEKTLYLVSENLDIDVFRLCDTGVLKNKTYKYTVILYDNLGFISEPYTFKVVT
ncbi:hypothetical protein U729_3146 (plasmid) [Clostridium baratii str. Sullivan]|uniref:Uncharacterized protein n=1 Tax=Clostridium baratii str. Sullivan TaxID=1415775 RepID=A0A0A7G2D7_9CLOT|nr:hypothetical protein [Clostridium baratii]AIY85210.1 hypothetical protein U729_3146 [Clostridium baratii str. Sullivan]